MWNEFKKKRKEQNSVFIGTLSFEHRSSVLLFIWTINFDLIHCSCWRHFSWDYFILCAPHNRYSWKMNSFWCSCNISELKSYLGVFLSLFFFWCVVESSWFYSISFKYIFWFHLGMWTFQVGNVKLATYDNLWPSYIYLYWSIKKIFSQNLTTKHILDILNLEKWSLHWIDAQYIILGLIHLKCVCVAWGDHTFLCCVSLQSPCNEVKDHMVNKVLKIFFEGYKTKFNASLQCVY